MAFYVLIISGRGLWLDSLIRETYHLKDRRARCTEEQFRELVKFNPDLSWELTAQGEVIVMAPTGSETGNYNFELNTDLGTWNRQQKTGKAFDSSAGFRLPNGAICSPDPAWIAQECW